jgi:hypothetical protein
MKKLALYLAMILAALSSNDSRAAIVFTTPPQREFLPGGLIRFTLSFSATTPGGVVAGFQGNFTGR